MSKCLPWPKSAKRAVSQTQERGWILFFPSISRMKHGLTRKWLWRFVCVFYFLHHMTLTFQVLTKSNDSRRLMYEICSSVLRQKLKFERMKELKSFVVGENVKEFEQNLADCLWLLDLETFSSVAETDEGLRKRFVQFVKGV